MTTWALACLFGASTFCAAAADGTSSNPADSKWRVRGRVIGIIPDDSSTRINLEAAGTKTPLQAGVSVDAAVVPELDITYMVTPHFGVELIAGIANHDVRIDGNDPVLGGFGVTDDFKIFDVWVLPPTMTFQYHFMPSAKFRPYAGVGVNYTAFLWNDATDRLERTLGSSVDVDTSSSWGWAAQFGFDYDIGGNWFANFDVKYIDIETTASLLVKNLGAGLRVESDINPWVIGAGIGYRF
ncbi:MAG: OmpW family outer membrane protein [Gammaproteobacteria bacterium]